MEFAPYRLKRTAPPLAFAPPISTLVDVELLLQGAV